MDVVDDIKAALQPAGPLASREGFLHVQLRTVLGCFVRHGVGPPSHGALGHLDGGGAAMGREQRREGSGDGVGRRVVRLGRRKPLNL